MGGAGGGQRLLGTFPKIHPFWYPDPSLSTVIVLFDARCDETEEYISIR